MTHYARDILVTTLLAACTSHPSVSRIQPGFRRLRSTAQKAAR